MKSSGPQQESNKKKQAGEYLKIADKLLKQTEFDAALVEVERCLELDPGNFYAHAYKERIIALRAKHQQQAHEPAPPAPKPEPPAKELQPKEAPPKEAAPKAAAPREEKAPERAAPPAKPADQQHVPLTQEEARKKFLEDKRRNEEELRKQAEEARRRAEEELRRRAQELEAMHTTESLERRKVQEDEKRKRDEELRRRRPADEERSRMEAEARRRAEELARKKLEEELQARNAGQQRAAQEAEALRAAEADARARAKEQKLYDYLLEAKDLLSKRMFAEAVVPLLKIATLEKGHAEALQMLAGLREIQEQAWAPKIKEAESVPRDAALALYRKALAVAYREGTPDAAVNTIISDLRKNLAITDAEHAAADPAARFDAYAAAYREQISAGAGDDDAFLARVRRELGISDEQHLSVKQKK